MKGAEDHSCGRKGGLVSSLRRISSKTNSILSMVSPMIVNVYEKQQIKSAINEKKPAKTTEKDFLKITNPIPVGFSLFFKTKIQRAKTSLFCYC